MHESDHACMQFYLDELLEVLIEITYIINSSINNIVNSQIMQKKLLNERQTLPK